MGTRLAARSRILAFIGLQCAIVASAWACVLCFATFATNDYVPVLQRALCWAIASATLIAASWRRLHSKGRALCVAVFFADLVAIIEVYRRLQIA